MRATRRASKTAAKWVAVMRRRSERLDAGFLKLASDSFADWNAPEADEAFRDL